MSNEKKTNEYEFYRNMRKTPWLRLFPHWWSENDALLKAIGDEVERIKALSIFSLLNAGLKPPVMTWKESVVHKQYHVRSNLTELNSFITIQAPLYKTWGQITLINNGEEIGNLKIMVNEDDGLFINQSINKDDKIIFDLKTQKTTINGKTINTSNIGEGIPYFKTVQNREEYDEDTPLHNEVIRIQFASQIQTKCDIDVDISLDDVVFTDEQNIEITGLELVPIERVDVYAKYDFPYNQDYNGWHKVYQKKYDKNTNVLYDMITIQVYTKEWYVEVYFKGLEYPYKVGFPCYRDAENDSMYHVNNRLDSWGDLLGLTRRNYKTNIAEQDYPTTYPTYYPYDIEQDYWYYKRLTHEYSWNHLAINDVDLKDTEGNNLVRLHSINPFVEDFVVHAKTIYPKDKVFQNYNEYIPLIVSEQDSKRKNQQSKYYNIRHLLTHDDNEANVTLKNKSGNNLRDLTYQSKELWTYFNLSDLPEDINIDNIEILVEGSSTDNKTDKYSNADTGMIIPHLYEDNITFIPLHADKNYQLSNQVITYSSNDLQKYLKELQDYTDEYIQQKTVIGAFEYEIGEKARIPIQTYENDEEFTDITDVWIYFDDLMVKGEYHYNSESKIGEVMLTIPKTTATKMTFIIKSTLHKPITTTIDIGMHSQNQYQLDKDGNYVMETIIVKDENGENKIDEKGNIIRESIPKVISIDQSIYGPLLDGKVHAKTAIIDEWHTKNVRNIIQQQGIYFRNIFENDNEQSETTLNIKNITLKVSYSEKKSLFHIDTHINTNVKSPQIGQYTATIKNIGEKPLHTQLDVINAPNIQLSQNTFPIDLEINQETTITANIYPQNPIEDGSYDILTVCEKYAKKDVINIFSKGLIETGIKLPSYHAKYNDPITIDVEILTFDNGEINSGNIEFYVNNHRITNNVAINNNTASITFTPSDYSFIQTGLQLLEVKFNGNDKYLSSKAVTDIFISKDNVILETNAKNDATRLSNYNLSTKVYSKDNKGNKTLVTNGSILYYANDIFLGYGEFQENMFSLEIPQLDLEPGKYTLWTQYTNSDVYSDTEISQPLRVFGGETNIHVFDIKASPIDTITIQATIKDTLFEPIQSGCATISITSDKFIIEDRQVPIVNGLIKGEGQIYNLEELLSDITFSDNEIIEALITVSFEGDGFISNSNTGTLTLSRKKATIIPNNIYNCTQDEPIGMLVRVVDADTNEPVTDGKITASFATNEEIFADANVDEDGYARIIFNPMVSTEIWDKTGQYKFFIGKDLPNPSYLTKNGESINLIEEYPNLFNDNTPLEEKNLFAIVDDNSIPKQVFTIDPEDGKLYYNENNEVENYFYIDYETGFLCRRTSYQPENYQTSSDIPYAIRFAYTDSSIYKKTYSGSNLLIQPSTTNLDLYTYNVNYDISKDVICYVSNVSDTEIEGQIVFYIDDIEFYQSDINLKKANIPYSKLSEIKYGNHLVKAEYINPINGEISYTYAKLYIDKIPSIIEYNNNFAENLVKGENAILAVTVSASDKEVSGFVNIYLDDELIDYQYLYGNEGYYGIIDSYDEHPYTIDDIIPQNLTEQYSNTIYFSIKMPDDLDVNHNHNITIEYEGNDIIRSSIVEIKNLQQTQLETRIETLETTIATQQETTLDINVFTVNFHEINEGYIQILYDTEILGRAPVRNNKASITWTPDKDITKTYTVQYVGNNSYEDSFAIISNNAEDTLPITIITPQEYIILNNDDSSEQEYVYASIRDAIQCLLPNGVIEIFDNEYIIEKDTNINKKVTIIGQDDTIIKLKGDLIINDNVTFNNVIVLSDKKQNIINRSNLKFIHSVLKNDIVIGGSGNLTINRSLVYCTINANQADLNNNWWGQNNPPYPVDNHIILTLQTINSPAVICDNIDVIGKLIGQNGREYNIPEVDFMLTADTGYFSIDNGKMINHEIYTTYFDAITEGNIYLTVDNETIEYPIYNYDRKTKIILEPITHIPINYYTTFTANIYSVTDSYDKKTNINGYIDFYFDNKHIGRSNIKNNKAQISTYIKRMNGYEVGEHKIKAIYTPTEYYFSSSKEETINIIETDKIFYVSSMGDDETNSGTFDAPFKTIQKAINESEDIASLDELSDRYIIFIKDEIYDKGIINIDKSVIIQSYNHNATFKDFDGDCIFNITNGIVDINKINFIENNTDNLIYLNDSARVYINHSLIYKNNQIVNNNNINIKNSAIIQQPISYANAYEYCWFGTNTPKDDIDDNINKYIVMTPSQSKTELYKGIVALVKGELLTYVTHEDNEIKRLPYKEKIPLRIAEFYSEDASLLPLKEYTYSNYATSLLSTNATSNSNRYNITLLNKEFYIKTDINMKYEIKDTIHEDNIIEDGIISVSVDNGEQQNFNISNGVATAIISPLTEGQHNIICTFTVNNTITQTEDIIVVRKHDIILNAFDAEYNNRQASFSATFNSSDEKIINDEKIDVYIDDTFVNTFNIQNNQSIGQIIKYDTLKSGVHKITLMNRKNSQYSNFVYNESFLIEKITPTITINYQKVQKNIENNLTITVFENQENFTQAISGKISVIVGDELVIDNDRLINGMYTFKHTFKNKGQYPILVYYNDNDYYNNTVESFNINVDIFKVGIVDLPEIISIDIGQRTLLKSDVLDISNNPVLKGYFNIYIDDILIKENLALAMTQFVYELIPPRYISSGDHTLKIEYIDEDDDYLDTTIYKTLRINKISTSIDISPFEMYPNQNTSISFNITSRYGNINTGTFSIEIEGEGKTTRYTTLVSDSLVQQINFVSPNLPAGNYTMTASYVDNEENYQNSTITTTVAIRSNKVIITPQYNNYYPQKELLFTVDITNQDNKRVNSGYVDVYIDNVKEIEHIKVINGQATTKYMFPVSKLYNINIHYYDDKGYYEDTYLNDYQFTVDRININDIDIVFNDETNIIEEIVFDTLDNYNVSDGILYLYIDDIQKGAYNITESHKYIDLDVNYLTQGNHTIALKYLNSFTFNDYNSSPNNDKNIIIQPKIPTLTIENGYTTTNNNIIINGYISTNGVIRLYICDIEKEHCKIIGIINENGNFTYDYTLPPTIDAGEYKIKAQFEGNGYYKEAITFSDLLIEKENKSINISIDNSTVQYEDSVNIILETEIPNALIQLAITDKKNKKILDIDNVVVNESTIVEYKLPTTLIGEYIITAEYQGSSMYMDAKDSCNITIIPYTPIIDDSTITFNIGGKLPLSNKVFNSQHEEIHTGVLKYYINEEINSDIDKTLILDAGTPTYYQMPIDITENFTMNVQYESENKEKLLDTESNIDVKPIKNDVNINIKAPQYINYNDVFYIEATLLSNTSFEINTQITVKCMDNDIISGDIEKDNNTYVIPCIISDDNKEDEYEIIITSEENTLFNESSNDCSVRINKMNYSTVDSENNLSDAIQLVKNNGIVEILEPITEPETIEINKNIEIQGNNIDISNINIINNEKLTIQDVNFNNSQIINNGTLEVKNSAFIDSDKCIIDNKNNMALENCTFKNNNVGSESCIQISSPNIHTIIDNCIFNNNCGLGNGTCISSNRVNELEILNTKFINNQSTNNNGACIYVYGNTAFYKNTFYNNNVKYEIRVIKSNIIAEKNIFDGVNIPIQFELNANGDLDLNYWGYDTEDIPTREDINISSDIEITNWLIGYLDIDEKEDKYIITPVITQYVNTLEKEITDINIDFDVFEVAKDGY